MISNTTISAKYTVTAGVLQFSIPFRIYKTTDVSVFWSSDGKSDTPLTLGTDYSVAIGSEGGTVTLVSGKVPVGSILAIEPNFTATQETDLSSTTAISTEALEAQLDKQTLLILQQQRRTGRAVILPATSSESPEDVVASIYASRDAAASSASAASNKADAAEVSAQQSSNSAAAAIAAAGNFLTYYKTAGDCDLFAAGFYICDNTAGNIAHGPLINGTQYRGVYALWKYVYTSGGSFIIYDHAVTFESVHHTWHRNFVTTRGTWSTWADIIDIPAYSKVCRATPTIAGRLTLQAVAGNDNVTLLVGSAGELIISRNSGDGTAENEAISISPKFGTIGGVPPASTAMSNLTVAGKAAVALLACVGDTVVSTSVPPSGGLTCAAPANGCFRMGLNSSAAGQFLRARRNITSTADMVTWSSAAGQFLVVRVDVRAGDQVLVEYSAGMTAHAAVFEYKEGG